MSCRAGSVCDLSATTNVEPTSSIGVRPEAAVTANESGRSTFDVKGRRSGEAAKGIHKRSLWAVPLDGIVRAAQQPLLVTWPTSL